MARLLTSHVNTMGLEVVNVIGFIALSAVEVPVDVVCQ